MQTIIGTLLDVTDRQREYDGRTWIEHSAHILDGIATVTVTLQGPSRDGRSQGLSPDSVSRHKGERIALEVYARGAKTGQVYYTATAVLEADDLATALGLVSV